MNNFNFQNLSVFQKYFLGFFALFVLVFLLHSPVFSAGFYWDDQTFLFGPESLSLKVNPLEFWLRGSNNTKAWPMTYSIIWFLKFIFGSNLLIFRIIALALHCLNGFLFFRLLSKLNFPFAFGGAAIFLLHPLHVEALSWVMQYNSILSTLFLLATLIFVTDYLKTNSLVKYLLVVLSFAASISSKSNTLLFCFLFFFLFLSVHNLKKSTLLALPLLILSIYFGSLAAIGVFTFLDEREYSQTYLYPGAKFDPVFSSGGIKDKPVAANKPMPWRETPSFDVRNERNRFPARVEESSGASKIKAYLENAFSHLPGADLKSDIDRLGLKFSAVGYVIYFYWKAFLFPLDQKAIYPQVKQYPWIAPLFTLLAAFALLGSFWLLYKKKLGIKDHRSFGIALYLLALVPVSGFFYASYMKFSIVADRWTYTVMLGMICILLYGLARIKFPDNFKKYSIWVWIICLSFLSFETYQYSRKFNSTPEALVIPYGNQ